MLLSYDTGMLQMCGVILKTPEELRVKTVGIVKLKFLINKH